MKNLPPAAPVLAPGAAPLAQIRRFRFAFLLLGIVLIILGMFALGHEFLFSWFTVVVYGWMLMIGGVLQAIQAFWARAWSGFFLNFFYGLLCLLVGLLVVARPGVGLQALTLLLACYFVVGGSFRFFGALAAPIEPKGWIIFSGLVDLVLGVLLIAGWPADSLWVIGLFVGINLLITGVFWIMLSLSIPKGD